MFNFILDWEISLRFLLRFVIYWTIFGFFLIWWLSFRFKGFKSFLDRGSGFSFHNLGILLGCGFRYFLRNWFGLSFLLLFFFDRLIFNPRRNRYFPSSFRLISLCDSIRFCLGNSLSWLRINWNLLDLCCVLLLFGIQGLVDLIRLLQKLQTYLLYFFIDQIENPIHFVDWFVQVFAVF